MENRFKLARTKYNQHGQQTVKEVSEITGVTGSLIDDLESTAGRRRDVGYSKIVKLAEHYGVTSDYLLGLSGTPSVKEDIQVVCKTTGLSTAVVDWLKSIIDDPVRLDTLNAILENETFQSVLPFINDLKNVQIAVEMSRFSGVKLPAREIQNGQYVVESWEYLSVLEYRIAELLKTVIDIITSPSSDK